MKVIVAGSRQISKMKKLVKRINELLSWGPHNIFYSTSHKYISYNSAHADGSVGHFATRTHYTRLGEFFNKLPAVPDCLIKLVYYIISWPLYLCIKIPWAIFCALFIPQQWK